MSNSLHTLPIAFYCSSISWGGLEMNVVRYARAFRDRGYAVLILATPESPIWKAAADAQLPIVAITRGRKYFDILRAYRCAQLFKRHQIGLCVFRDTYDMDTLVRAKRFSRHPFKLVYHQAMQLGVEKKDVFHTRRFKGIDAWVALLPYLKTQVQSMTRFPAERIHVVPLGIDPQRIRIGENLRASSRAQLNLSEDAFVVGLMGRLDPLKGQHVAIEALAQVRSKGYPIQLVLMGDATLHEGNDYHRRISALLEKHALTNVVRLLPGQSDVAAFYHAIDAFALCSAGETFGNVNIEAMAIGLPIIGTNSSGTPEILDHGRCGLLFPPGDAVALADAMAELYDHPDKRTQLSADARARFEKNYTIEQSVTGLEDVFEKCMNNAS